jgi:hypothetical protein
VTVSFLIVGYAAIGVALAAWIATRRTPSWSTMLSAGAALVIWPLWAPFALAQPVSPTVEPRRAAERRVLRALASARDAVQSTPLDVLLSQRDRDAIVREVTRIARRLDLVEAELDSASAGRDQASAGRARRMARLEELALADRRALEELAELAELLATELMLARFGQGDGVEQLVQELAARVEALAQS